MLPSLRAKRDELKRRPGRSHQYRAEQSRLAEKQSGLADAYAATRWSRSGLPPRVTVQKDMLRDGNRKLFELPKERELTRLMRASDVAETIYTNLLSNLEKARVDRTRNTDSVVIAERASPADPKSPFAPTASATCSPASS